ncbi:PIN domain-containing protein [Patescibacteria group bacterium]|nr:PIN domain-containing protein [Patescibacteria group bacterium]MBU1702950.1 PIN domain-containing protein [Patescibacteria group bacterium]MBU1953958.1 PIN domain-containing protein [Patescibacteria group bacterium]
MEQLVTGDRIIIVPTLVYIEIINNLYRLKIKNNKINWVENFLRRGKVIHICHSTSSFWLNEIAPLMEKVDLRSHDLIILAHAIKYQTQLISFDNKMGMAYKKISNNNY